MGTIMNPKVLLRVCVICGLGAVLFGQAMAQEMTLEQWQGMSRAEQRAYNQAAKAELEAMKDALYSPQEWQAMSKTERRMKMQPIIEAEQQKWGFLRNRGQ